MAVQYYWTYADRQPFMIQKKILLLSVSAGAGHTRAAEAIRSQVKSGNCGITAIHLDAMQFVAWWLRRIYIDLYIFIVKRSPILWGYLYQISNTENQNSLMHRIRRWIEWHSSQPLLKAIAEIKPDFVVCTHFFPAELLSKLIANGNLKCPVWVQVTDFDLHKMWGAKKYDRIFCAQ